MMTKAAPTCPRHVFTLLDRDKATAYPQSCTTSGPSAPARELSGRLPRHRRDDFLSNVADALGIDKLHVVETEVRGSAGA